VTDDNGLTGLAREGDHILMWLSAPSAAGATVCAMSAPRSGSAPRATMPVWIFAVALIWLLVLVGVFVLYQVSDPFRDALPSQIGKHFPLEVPYFGALGGLLVSFTGIVEYNQEWCSRFNYWHPIKPLLGAISGSVAGILLLVTSDVATKGSTTTNPYFYAAVAFVFGYGEGAFRSLIKSVTNVLIKPGDGPPPQSSSCPSGHPPEPPQDPAGTAQPASEPDRNSQSPGSQVSQAGTPTEQPSDSSGTDASSPTASVWIRPLHGWRLALALLAGTVCVIAMAVVIFRHYSPAISTAVGFLGLCLGSAVVMIGELNQGGLDGKAWRISGLGIAGILGAVGAASNVAHASGAANGASIVLDAGLCSVVILLLTAIGIIVRSNIQNRRPH
jgi:hypothetical protein